MRLGDGASVGTDGQLERGLSVSPHIGIKPLSNHWRSLSVERLLVVGQGSLNASGEKTGGDFAEVICRRSSNFHVIHLSHTADADSEALPSSLNLLTSVWIFEQSRCQYK